MEGKRSKPYDPFPCSETREQGKKISFFCGETKKRTHQELTFFCGLPSTWVKKPRTGCVRHPYVVMGNLDFPSISGSKCSMPSGKSDYYDGLFSNNNCPVTDSVSSVLARNRGSSVPADEKQDQEQYFSKDDMEVADALIFLKYSHNQESDVKEEDPSKIEKKITEIGTRVLCIREEDPCETEKKMAEIGNRVLCNQEDDDDDDDVLEGEDPWKIKKKLTKSDIGDNSRLMLSRPLVKDYILDLLDDEVVSSVESEGEHEVSVWDVDSKTEHRLVFKQWKSSNSYVLIGGWRIEFVKRRNLDVNDQIGLFYDVERARFNFSVLQRARLSQPRGSKY